MESSFTSDSHSPLISTNESAYYALYNHNRLKYWSSEVRRNSFNFVTSSDTKEIPGAISLYGRWTSKRYHIM